MPDPGADRPGGPDRPGGHDRPGGADRPGGPDRLAGAVWELAPAPPGEPPPAGDDPWMAAQVPGTVAGALLGAGRWVPWGSPAPHLTDRDWWYRTTVPDGSGADTGPCWLLSGGLATSAEVHLDGHRVLATDSMFAPLRTRLDEVRPGTAVTARFAALDPVLAVKRPRPRWKSTLVEPQSLRWVRTSLVGWMPGEPQQPVTIGPWRGLRLVSERPGLVLDADIRTGLAGGDGTVDVAVLLAGPVPAAGAVELRSGAHAATVEIYPGGEPGTYRVSGRLVLRAADRWWPHTHGDPVLHPLELAGPGWTADLGPIGFRTVAVDRTDGGFQVVVNGTPVFCRGACWVPPDQVLMDQDRATAAADLRRAADAGFNMVRVPGTGVYPDHWWWAECDRLGLLVWLDAMWASMDPPADPAWEDGFVAEVTAHARAAAGHPALAVLCGGSEVEQQAAMLGRPPDQWVPAVLADRLPTALAAAAPGIAYVSSSPTGGDFPFSARTGVSHYFGVGTYRRPLSDARTAGVRFAAECLAFSSPPEPASVDLLGGAARAGHDPRWKGGIHGHHRPFDDEDVRDYYVAALFGLDARQVASAEPDYALDLGRAAVTEAVASTLAAWRPARSGCAGALALHWRDPFPGAGWGLVDWRGRPKAPLYALRRLLAPRAVWWTDDGLDGPGIHLANDRSEPWRGRLVLRAHPVAGGRPETGVVDFEVGPGGQHRLSADVVLGGFRDLNWAYRFGPPAYDALEVLVSDADAGDTESGGTGDSRDACRDRGAPGRDPGAPGRDPGAPGRRAVHLPLGPARAREGDVGLSATATPAGPKAWRLRVATERLAQWVALDCPGYELSDSWFHLPGRTEHDVRLVAGPGAPDRPAGTVRALNSVLGAPITCA